MPILSIIIPVHNAENHISTCIDSIRNQTFSDFELILVNDGSQDRSGLICERYNRLDNRIRVIHQANSGASAARNKGLSFAKGEFIAMVDSDDTVDKDMYSILMDSANENNVDLVVCGIKEVIGNKVIDRSYNLPDHCVMNENDIINRIIASDYTSQNIINSPCNKLYKRELIEEHHLRFPTRVRGEDWMFNIYYLQIAKSAIYIDKPLYHYRRHNESTMTHYLPNQFELWLENRKIRKGILKKYDLKINILEYNRIWVEKVLYYLLAIPSNASRTIMKVLKNKEFKEACSSSYKLSNKFLNTIKLINGYGYWILAFPIIWCVNQLKRL